MARIPWAHPVATDEYGNIQGGMDVSVILKSIIKAMLLSATHFLY